MRHALVLFNLILFFSIGATGLHAQDEAPSVPPVEARCLTEVESIPLEGHLLYFEIDESETTIGYPVEQVMLFDGSELTPLFRMTAFQSAIPSPDRRELVVVVNQPQGRRAYRLLEDLSLEPLLSPLDEWRIVSWTPDDQLVFTTLPREEAGVDLILTGIDIPENTIPFFQFDPEDYILDTFSFPDAEAYAVSGYVQFGIEPSPDASRVVVFPVHESTNDLNVPLELRDTQTDETLWRTEAAYPRSLIVWSPDSSAFVYTQAEPFQLGEFAGHSAEDRKGLVLVTGDGDSQHLTAFNDDDASRDYPYAFTWSTDGRYLAYIWSHDNRLYIFDRTHQITYDLCYNVADTTNLHWSPDGTQVLIEGYGQFADLIDVSTFTIAPIPTLDSDQYRMWMGWLRDR